MRWVLNVVRSMLQHREEFFGVHGHWNGKMAGFAVFGIVHVRPFIESRES